MMVIITIMKLREEVKYYFADFVRKGGGIPQIRNPFFAENFIPPK